MFTDAPVFASSVPNNAVAVAVAVTVAITNVMMRHAVVATGSDATINRTAIGVVAKKTTPKQHTQLNLQFQTAGNDGLFTH